MILNNLKLINGEDPVSISVKAGTISAVLHNHEIDFKNDLHLHFDNAIAIPGLINSHDHLDFNCFAPLGQRIYDNYTEWGRHIHDTYRDEIKAVLSIPQRLRSAWGVYKNMIAGVTTVVNHGSMLDIDEPLIHVHQQSQSLHSVGFQERWKWKLNNPLLKYKDCVIHTGEGIDERSSSEIDELLKWNLIKRNLIGIHAVAMNITQAKKFKGLVWCPVSNRFLFNKDATISRLKNHTQVVFGTDSTLTGSWNIWDHLRMARSTGQVQDEELFEMVTSKPASLWRQPTGKLSPGKNADIVVIRSKQHDQWNDFYSTNPSDILLVMQAGKVRMFDKDLLPQMEKMKIDVSDFYPVSVDERPKFVEGNLPKLLNAISNYYPKAVFPCDYFEKINSSDDEYDLG